jgi:hypothetical protein
MAGPRLLDVRRFVLMACEGVGTPGVLPARGPIGTALVPLVANVDGILSVRLVAGTLELTSRAPSLDAVDPAGVSAADTAAFGYLLNGAGLFDRARAVSALLQAAAQKIGVAAVALVGNWSAIADPAAAAQATVTRAAGGAGVRHVCTSIQASVSAGAAVATGIRKVYLRDGAAGVGAILWSATLQAVLATNAHIELSGLSIVGTANTAMTLEFDAGAGAASQEDVTLTGYDVA